MNVTKKITVYANLEDAEKDALQTASLVLNKLLNVMVEEECRVLVGAVGEDLESFNAYEIDHAIHVLSAVQKLERITT